MIEPVDTNQTNDSTDDKPFQDKQVEVVQKDTQDDILVDSQSSIEKLKTEMSEETALDSKQEDNQSDRLAYTNEVTENLIKTQPYILYNPTVVYADISKLLKTENVKWSQLNQ